MPLSDQTRDYDPTARGLVPPVVTLEGVVRQALRAFAQDFRVCTPCQVVAVHGNYRVDLQPLQQAQFYAEAKPTTLPIIPNAPVCQPGGVNWQVRYPIDVGDVGYAIHADRALETWLAGDGSPADPQDARTHALTDAIYVPGLATDALAGAREDATNDLIMRNGDAEVRLERNGTFRIANQGQEFVDLTIQLQGAVSMLVSIMQSAMVLTPLGPAAFYAQTQTQLISLTTELNAISQNLATLKGTK